MELTFPQSRRLKTPAEFKRVFDRKKSVADAVLVIYAAENYLPHSRVGLSVSKKVGNAVVRNRWKRLCREAFRLNQHELPSGFDFILIPRSSTTEPTLQRVEESLKSLVGQVVRRLGVNLK